MAHHELQTHPLVLRQLSVLRSEQVSETMLRVTLGGEQLRAWTQRDMRLAGFTSTGFDDHVKLIFGQHGQSDQSVLPIQLPGGIDWPTSESRETRDYTPRRFDPELGELDLDFVLHGAGPAAQWATAAVPGSELWLVGPKSSVILPERLDWLWLIGDETALPAIGRFLDERPSNAAVRLTLLVPSKASEQNLHLGPDDEVHWLYGSATDRQLLETFVREQDIPSGEGYFWAAGESRTLLPLRRFARTTLGLPASQINITGYWHQQEQVAPLETKQQRSEEVAPGDSAPASPASWFALRAALQLGIIDALAETPTPLTRTALAQAIGVPLQNVSVLLDQLQHDGVVLSSDLGLSLGRYAEELAEDEHEREGYLGLQAETILAMQELAPALRMGVSAWSLHRGKNLAAEARGNQELAAELIEEAERIKFVAGSLSALNLWDSVSAVAATGPGSSALAETLAVAGSLPRWQVVDEPAALELLRAEAKPSSVVDYLTEWQRQELLISVLEVSNLSDSELLDRLREYAQYCGRLLIIEGLRPDGLSPNGQQQLLFRQVRAASGARGVAELKDLAEQGGWRLNRQESLGWDIEAFELLNVEAGAS